MAMLPRTVATTPVTRPNIGMPSSAVTNEAMANVLVRRGEAGREYAAAVAKGTPRRGGGNGAAARSSAVIRIVGSSFVDQTRRAGAHS